MEESQYIFDEKGQNFLNVMTHERAGAIRVKMIQINTMRSVGERARLPSFTFRYQLRL